MIDIPLLRELCGIPGPAGFEDRIRERVRELVGPLCDELREDRMGNLIATVKGKSSDASIMAAGHLDEIGFIVTQVDDQGFLRFHTLGGFDPKTLTSMRVMVHGEEDLPGVMGSKPVHLMSAEERGKAVKTTDFFIDLGLPQEEVLAKVPVGSPVTRVGELIEVGRCVCTKSLDNRVSVFLLVEALRRLQQRRQKPPQDFHAVFTVQEEVGLRGAIAAAAELRPHFGIGLDTTIAFDTPGARKDEQISRLGGGVAIKLMDSSVICDQRMVRYLKALAERHEIRWQPEILPAGGTDTAGIQRAPGGAIVGALSVPSRNVHQTVELGHVEDIAGALDLLVEAVVSIDRFDILAKPVAATAKQAGAGESPKAGKSAKPAAGGRPAKASGAPKVPKARR